MRVSGTCGCNTWIYLDFRVRMCNVNMFPQKMWYPLPTANTYGICCCFIFVKQESSCLKLRPDQNSNQVKSDHSCGSQVCMSIYLMSIQMDLLSTLIMVRLFRRKCVILSHARQKVWNYMYRCIVHAGVFVCCSAVSGASCCCWCWCSLTLCLGLLMFRGMVSTRLKLYSCPVWIGFLVIKSFLINKVSVYIQSYSPKCTACTLEL